MRRIQQPRNLPPLASLRPAPARLPAGGLRTYALLQAVRRLATRLRGDEPVPFYSVRQVGDFFDVSLATVAQVFRALEAEGLLVRLRSTITLLQPARPHPREPVCGVVGLPVWQWGYCHLTEWRRFFGAFEEALARHRWIADLLFFEEVLTNLDAFRERLLARHPDAVVWFKPILPYRACLETLRDRGVSVAVVSDGAQAWPCRDYRLQREQATARALREWKRADVTSITVHDNEPTQADPHLIAMLDRLGFRHQRVTFTATEFGSYVRRVPRHPNRGELFPDDGVGSFLSYSRAEDVATMLRQHRVLFRGGLDNHRQIFTGCRADFVTFDWPALAARIADDIATGQVLRGRQPVTVQAKLHLRAEASKFAQAF